MLRIYCYFIWYFWSCQNLCGIFCSFSRSYAVHASFGASQRERSLFSFVKVMGIFLFHSLTCLHIFNVKFVESTNLSVGTLRYSVGSDGATYFPNLLPSEGSLHEKASKRKTFLFVSCLILWIFIKNAI